MISDGANLRFTDVNPLALARLSHTEPDADNEYLRVAVIYGTEGILLAMTALRASITTLATTFN